MLLCICFVFSYLFSFSGAEQDNSWLCDLNQANCISCALNPAACQDAFTNIYASLRACQVACTVNTGETLSNAGPKTPVEPVLPPSSNQQPTGSIPHPTGSMSQRVPEPRMPPIENPGATQMEGRPAPEVLGPKTPSGASTSESQGGQPTRRVIGSAGGNAKGGAGTGPGGVGGTARGGSAGGETGVFSAGSEGGSIRATGGRATGGEGSQGGIGGGAFGGNSRGFAGTVIAQEGSQIDVEAQGGDASSGGPNDGTAQGGRAVGVVGNAVAFGSGCVKATGKKGKGKGGGAGIGILGNKVRLISLEKGEKVKEC